MFLTNFVKKSFFFRSKKNFWRRLFCRSYKKKRKITLPDESRDVYWKSQEIWNWLVHPPQSGTALYRVKIWNVPGGLDLCLYTNEILNYKNLWFCVIWWPPSTYCILSTWMYCMYYQEQPMQEALQVHEEMRNFEFGDPPARSGLWILSHFVATWVWRHQYGQMTLTLGYVSSICTDHQPQGCNWWILNWSTFITIRFRFSTCPPVFLKYYFMQKK